jgi:hypothetical protein
MRKIGIVVIAVLLGAALAAAAQPPKPGPEQQELAYLVGRWTFEGVYHATRMGPAAKESGSFEWRWFPGGLQIVRELQAKGGRGGEVKAFNAMGYDPSSREYLIFGMSDGGLMGLYRATLSAGAWTLRWSETSQGRKYDWRGTLKMVPPDTVLWTAEYSEDGKTWTVDQESRDTRVKAAPAR